jgi:hypothetical protein
MRKLRRLPWRIPKSHGPRQPAPIQKSTTPEPFAHIEAERDKVETLPVAFAGGRYVYGDAPSVDHRARPTEIRRKSRHRWFGPVPAIG